MTSDFDDLLAANRRFAETFEHAGTPGMAGAGVAIVTCMDSRIDPLGMLGMTTGDVKVVRNPGGRVTSEALEALVLAAHFLEVDRILVVPHTRCAVASSTEAELRERLSASAGADTTWQAIPVTDDQQAALAEDVEKVRSHPLIPDDVKVGGFLFDVDTGLLEQLA